MGLLADWMSGGSNKPPAAERTKIGRDRLREALVNAVPKVWNFAVDGHELGEEMLFLEVLNARFIGPALPLGPSSALGDQLLDVVYLLPEKRSEMLSWLDNPEGTSPPVVVRQGRKVIVQWNGGHLHIDDRVQPTPERPAQVKIKLMPTSLRVCAPNSGTKCTYSHIAEPLCANIFGGQMAVSHDCLSVDRDYYLPRPTLGRDRGAS